MYGLINVVILILMLILKVQCDNLLVRQDNLLVRQTANGIEGIMQTSSLGQKYYAFKGVPYAEPPITGKDPYTGDIVDRRFKAPEPLKRTWTTNFEAHNFGYACFNSSEFDESFAKRSEDCLSLNIYVPAGGAENKTVLVFIHGGGYTEGDYSDTYYGPDFLMSEDNILVTIQYRVAIFGFLNLGTPEYSGNMGLKDQQLALKWVHENIENFSGNNDEIMIFGQSAGGASVVFHMLNEESRKYFNRVYAMSGSGFDDVSLVKENHVGRMQECTNMTDLDQIVEYLKSTESEMLTQCYSGNWGEILVKANWIPTIESVDTEGAFITQTYGEIYNSDKAPVIDVLFSFTSQENIAFYPEMTKLTEPLIPANVSESLVRFPFDNNNFNKENYPNEFKEALEKLRDAYFMETTDPSTINLANIDLLSELNINYNILKNVFHQVEANSKGNDGNQPKNVFLLRYNKSSELNLYKSLQGLEYEGATHGDDICTIFHCHVADLYKLYDEHLKNKNSTIYKSIMQMVQIITNFARTGDPSIKGDTPFRPCTSENIFCQEIDNNSTSSVTTNIMEQLHFETWYGIEKTYRSIVSNATFIEARN